MAQEKEKKVLHLTLKKKWFDMIASGEKKEEYRDIVNHWEKRLAHSHPGSIGGDFMDKHKVIAHTFKEWDIVTFSHGYKPDAPRINVEFNGIEITTGKPEWGAEQGKKYFVIKLGNVLTP